MTTPGQSFEPASGDGPPPPEAGRAAELRTAYEGLLQIRRLVNGPAGAAVPAPWELRLMPRAVALVLEAAGIPASAQDPQDPQDPQDAEVRRIRTGYRVGPAASGEDRVEVTWLGPPGGGAAEEEQERLTACAAVLEPLGWVCLLYRGPRRRRFLEVEPPPAS
ncbi:hypothetical protein [Streptomyces sp. NBC_00503]|uniref:hypothetical protein n=1 Tax=Streptomyces sp. NBC_00503 TaxID=2903659 RepID=UPI002E805F7F|nr:hypothetical protein [Streptomyces sp. NBC_00503]WUD79819.1 hypothetical protein OG490_04115 [Streptomyces sp. NBC_00503]